MIRGEIETQNTQTAMLTKLVRDLSPAFDPAGPRTPVVAASPRAVKPRRRTSSKSPEAKSTPYTAREGDAKARSAGRAEVSSAGKAAMPEADGLLAAPAVESGWRESLEQARCD